MNKPANPFAAHNPYAAGPGAAAAYGTAPAAASAADLVYDVTEADVQTRVLERSLLED